MKILDKSPNWFILSLSVVAVIDMIGTAIGLHFGWVEELNPMLAPIVKQFGVLGFIMAKTVCILYPVGIIFILTQKIPRRRANALLLAGTLLYGLILAGSIIAQI